MKFGTEAFVTRMCIKVSEHTPYLKTLLTAWLVQCI
jgi:hypothetical protein